MLLLARQRLRHAALVSRKTDRDDMVENGVISVTCEFCSETYVFQPADVADDKAGESA